MNSKRLLFFSIIIGTLMAMNGCSKFLDILPPSTAVNPTKIKDFQEMLNNDSLSTVHFYFLDHMSDDVALTDASFNKGDSYFRRIHTWDAKIWDPAQDDEIYNSCYARILQMNVILNRIDAAPEDESNTPANRSNVLSQALINRAYYYLQLVNAYGAAYDASTASKDLGVPLVLLPSTDVLPSRATVEQVYAAIIDDLRRAVDNPYLPSKGADIIHPGLAAGYGLLARAYLYKGDYAAALTYANLSLAKESTLLNLNTTTYYPGRLLNLVSNPEVLVGRFSYDYAYYPYYSATFNASQSLIDSMGGLSNTDRRYTQKFNGRTLRLNTYSTLSLGFDNSVAVPEMMLIKAECLARNGDVSGASALLTTLRTNRMPAASVTGTRVYNANNILRYVLGERRRELFLHGGLRLFDLKRLNKDPRFKQDIIRQNEARTVTLVTLPAGSPRYLLPFSPNVIAANPNIVQNPR